MKDKLRRSKKNSCILFFLHNNKIIAILQNLTDTFSSCNFISLFSVHAREGMPTWIRRHYWKVQPSLVVSVSLSGNSLWKLPHRCLHTQNWYVRNLMESTKQESSDKMQSITARVWEEVFLIWHVLRFCLEMTLFILGNMQTTGKAVHSCTCSLVYIWKSKHEDNCVNCQSWKNTGKAILGSMQSRPKGKSTRIKLPERVFTLWPFSNFGPRKVRWVTFGRIAAGCSMLWWCSFLVGSTHWHKTERHCRRGKVGWLSTQPQFSIPTKRKERRKTFITDGSQENLQWDARRFHWPILAFFFSRWQWNDKSSSNASSWKILPAKFLFSSLANVFSLPPPNVDAAKSNLPALSLLWSVTV